jgi:hypothetical protein
MMWKKDEESGSWGASTSALLLKNYSDDQSKWEDTDAACDPNGR